MPESVRCWAPAIERVLHDVTLFNLSFVVKWPGEESELPLHQDWSYVDERASGSVTIWIPLDATSVERGNGPIHALTGSHRLPAYQRGANTVPWYQPLREVIGSHLEPVTADSGEAVIFDSRLLHASPPNRSDLPRRAILAMACGRSTPLRYYHQHGNQIWAYAITPRFFVDTGPVELRANPPDPALVVERCEAPRAVAPADELSRLLSVDVADVTVAPPTEPEFALRGTVPDEGSRDRCAGGLAGVDDRRLRRALRGLRRRFLASRLDAAVELETRFGRAESRRVRGRWPRPARVYVVVLEPGSETTATTLAGARSDGRISVLPIEAEVDPGDAVCQVGRAFVPIVTHESFAFDPRSHFLAWNTGPRPVTLLVVCGPASRRRS
jgi:hypothetical protein